MDRYGKGIVKGMALTIQHLLRRPVTTQYPDERLTISRRARGNELIWMEERCSGCTTCARTCSATWWSDNTWGASCNSVYAAGRRAFVRAR